jgi:hypothetical protein
MPDWIGDQMAGVRPEVTRVFGWNAQIAVIAKQCGERVKSTLCCPLDRPNERAESARKRTESERDGCPGSTVPDAGRCAHSLLSASIGSRREALNAG